MTTRWSVPPGMWKGETVAVLAGGPSMNQQLADSVRQYKRIVVNNACRLAPDAEMWVAIDSQPDYWVETHGFTGLRICGGEDEESDAFYVGQMWEKVVLGINNVVEIRNSGLAAIRIAAATGASKILLLGFDPDLAIDGEYVGLKEGLAAIMAELRALGIEVERIDTLHAAPAEKTSTIWDKWGA